MARITQRNIKGRVAMIKYYTKHEVEAFFGIGCYLTIDGVEYEHYITKGRNAGTYEGISNREAWNLLQPLFEEAMEVIRASEYGYLY